MVAERFQIDVDDLMQTIREDVAKRSPATSEGTNERNIPQASAEIAVIPQPQPSTPAIKTIATPPQSEIAERSEATLAVQLPLWRRASSKAKRYLLAVARRAKQRAGHVRRTLIAKKHRIQAAFIPAAQDSVPLANPLIERSDSTIRVAILTPCLVDGDAVGNDVIGMSGVLSQQSYDCQIFAEAWAVSEVNVKHISLVQEFLTKPSDILIYHYSIGWDLGLAPLQAIDCKKVIKYHNVTPPEYYEDFNEEYANVCRAGRAQLNAITQIQNAVYLSDSDYNASELHHLGVDRQKSSVLPPFHYIDRLQYTEPDFSVLDAYRDGKFNVLMVGRLVPNKGHAALIDAFTIYHNSYNQNSRLLIVGKADPRLSKYNDFLRQKVADLGLSDAIVFVGGVSAQALKAHYLVSHAFMITSDHEGFCVPLVEAMSIKLPIVAYGSTAIPTTVGKAGLVWQHPDPDLLAGALNSIATSEAIRHQLGELGWERYQEMFTNRRIESDFLELINRLAVGQSL